MNFFKDLIGNSKSTSSKRLIGMTTVVVIYIIALVDLFSNYTVSEFVFDGLIWLAIGGLFGIASERFAEAMTAKNSNKNATPQIDTTVNKNQITPVEGEIGGE